MKICNKCNLEQADENFPFKDKKKGRRQNTCKFCHKIYIDNHYQNNKQVYKDKSRRNTKKYVAEFSQYKETLSCEDCKISFKDKPWLCDFHHLDPNLKDFNIAYKKHYGTVDNIREELIKCIPLCANCHRTRHYLNMGI